MTKMLVQDVITRLQRQFGDEASVQVTPADVIRWINDCQREVVMQHENLFQATGTIDTVAGTNVYPLPTDAISIQLLEGRDTVDSSYFQLRYLSPEALAQEVPDYSASSGTPVFYTRGAAEGNLTLIPTPDSSITGGIRLQYSRYSQDVSSATDALDLPEYYHQVVLEFCLMKAYEMDENWEAADRKAQYVQSTVDFNNNREGWFGHSTYPSVTTVAEDYE
jgi:hypothetical protein